MFFVLPMKTKKKIYDKLVDFRIWIEPCQIKKNQVYTFRRETEEQYIWYMV